MYVLEYYTHWLEYFYEPDLTKIQRQKYNREVEVGYFRDYATKKISYLKQSQRKRENAKAAKKDTIFLSEDEHSNDDDETQIEPTDKEPSREDGPLGLDADDSEQYKDQDNPAPPSSGLVVSEIYPDSSQDMFDEENLESPSEEETG